MHGRDLVTFASDEVAYKINVDNPTASVESTDISSVISNVDAAFLDSNGDYVVMDSGQYCIRHIPVRWR